MNKQNSECGDTITETERKSAKKICSGIYGLRNRMNNKWYVGQSMTNIEDRWSKYRRMACKSQKKLILALEKYGYENFDKVVLESCPPDIEILNSREDYWIDYHDSINNGYNIRRAGSRGKFSVESREKMSVAHIGKSNGPQSMLHRRRISIAKTGKKRKPFSDECKARMKESQAVRRAREKLLRQLNTDTV